MASCSWLCISTLALVSFPFFHLNNTARDGSRSAGAEANLMVWETKGGMGMAIISAYLLAWLLALLFGRLWC